MKDKNQTNEFESRYPTKDYNKVTYSFDSQELRKLASLDTINQMGEMAKMMINQVVQGECMPRVGAKNSQDIGVLYDLPRGQFILFTPKVWCEQCKNRKATLEFNKKFYCDSCYNLVKTVEDGKGKLKEKK